MGARLPRGRGRGRRLARPARRRRAGLGARPARERLRHHRRAHRAPSPARLPPARLPRRRRLLTRRAARLRTEVSGGRAAQRRKANDNSQRAAVGGFDSPVGRDLHYDVCVAGARDVRALLAGPPREKLMAEDLPSREILEQLVERLDHLERVLQANTARLHAVERRLGVEPPPPVRTRPTLQERYPDELEKAVSAIHATEPGGAAAEGGRAPQDELRRAAATDAGAASGETAGHAPGASAEDGTAPKGVETRAGAKREVKRRDLESLIG